MKILIIDSHKSTTDAPQQNLHWKNAKILADALGADLIWSYPTVNDIIKTGYDVIIFNHASNYSYVDKLWLDQNPNAVIYYITNEYNLGEPYVLWAVAKAGRNYNVIANHEAKISKIVKKYVDNWYITNLNTLVFDPVETEDNCFFEIPKQNCIYYGSFRKGRIDSFKKYLKENIILSTHESNITKFKKIGCTSSIRNRIQWNPIGYGLEQYKFSLYIEDKINHENYNHLANRFYESLNYDVISLFDSECIKNINLSGYRVPDELIIKDYEDLLYKIYNTDEKLIQEMLTEWKVQAHNEKIKTINEIISLIKGEI